MVFKRKLEKDLLGKPARARQSGVWVTPEPEGLSIGRVHALWAGELSIRQLLASLLSGWVSGKAAAEGYAVRGCKENFRRKFPAASAPEARLTCNTDT